jgi:hypothetical protein
MALFSVRWDSQPLIEYLKEVHNFDVEAIGEDPLTVLANFLKDTFNLDLAAIKADPRAAAKEWASVIEHCVKGDPITEMIDGMTIEVILTVIFEKIASVL